MHHTHTHMYCFFPIVSVLSSGYAHSMYNQRGEPPRHTRVCESAHSRHIERCYNVDSRSMSRAKGVSNNRHSNRHAHIQLAVSATCVQRFDDSQSSAIRTTYRSLLRSSSLREPRYPPLRVVSIFICFRATKVAVVSSSSSSQPPPSRACTRHTRILC